MMPAVNRVTVRRLRSLDHNHNALLKYAAIGKIFAESENKSDAYYVDFLLDTIQALTEEMRIPKLSEGGVTRNDFERIVKITDNKNHPLNLNDEEMIEALELST